MLYNRENINIYVYIYIHIIEKLVYNFSKEKNQYNEYHEVNI